ncbi:MAG: DNA repair protein RadC [Rickettsiales bacterium]|nr:DNA repair protein RadC [Rickettsiales bacterium]
MSDETPHYIGHRQRLRERFLSSDKEQFSDYELLELLLFNAKPRGDVKPLAKRLLKTFGSYEKVVRAPELELRKVAEVGDAVVATLKAIETSVQRVVKAPVMERPVIQSWTALLDYCRLVMGAEKIEQFRIFFLNHKNTLIADEVQQKGTVNHTQVYPREVVKRALELSASSIILAHNHPSGDVTPSQADIDMTQKIIQAARAVNITVHDHVIVSESEHYSFKSFGLI